MGAEASSGSASVPRVQRLPMRNKLEGYFTKWHEDIGFDFLRPALVRLYPDLHTLPSAEQVLADHRRWEQYQKDLRGARSAEKNRMTDAID